MYIARTLSLLMVTVSAMMAIGASNASAVTIVDEATGVQCSAITETVPGPAPSKTEVTGGCPVQASSLTGAPVELGGPFGIMILCPVYIEGRISGSGHAVAAIFQVGGNDRTANRPPATTTCTQNWAVPCNVAEAGAGEIHPEAQVTSTVTPSTTWDLEAEFCIRTYLGTKIDCHINGRMTETAGHNYALVDFVSHSTTACEDNPGYTLQGTASAIYDAVHPKLEASG